MKLRIRWAAAGILSIAALLSLQSFSPGAAPRCAAAMLRASQIMDRTIIAIRNQRQRSGAGIDLQADPNRTGLIGPKHSPLTTTLGELAAKRSTTNPNMAGLIVYLLDRAGVRAGDSLAIASSGSFPALLVASLAAARAMDVHPITLLSLGASSFGATEPDFTLLDLYALLQQEHICDTPPAGVSLGGEKDTGTELDEALQERLTLKIRASGIPFLHEPDLRLNVAERLRIYERNARGRIAAFVNSGGGYANMGTSSMVLEVKPGLSLRLRLPAPDQRGVLFEMSARSVPVVHLLFIKGLVSNAGLPWDPIPLPKPGSFVPLEGRRSTPFWLITGAYLAILFLLLRK